MNWVVLHKVVMSLNKLTITAQVQVNLNGILLL